MKIEFLFIEDKMSFFEALLHCYLLFSTTSGISLLSRTSFN